MKFFLLINVKMPTMFGVLTIMSGKNSILGLSDLKKPRVEHVKSFIASGPDLIISSFVCLTEMSMRDRRKSTNQFFFKKIYSTVSIWCQNDVVSTLIRRHFYVMCLLGRYIILRTVLIRLLSFHIYRKYVIPFYVDQL